MQLGHISQGNNPYLVDNLSHRGLTIQREITDRLSFDVSTQSGREITGYNDILGFTTSKSQITTATLGYELLERNGGARLEFSYSIPVLIPYDHSGLSGGQHNVHHSFWAHSTAKDNTHEVSHLENNWCE